MAIQIPNVGTGVPADQTGDSPWLAMKKVADNFSNTTHAASRLVGAGNGKIPLHEQVHSGALTNVDGRKTEVDDANDFPVGTRYACNGVINGGQEHFASEYSYIETYGKSNAEAVQICRSISVTIPNYLVRRKFQDAWSPWAPIGSASFTYTQTSAIAANVVVDSTGVLRRSSSSEKYKDILSDLELDDKTYNQAMQVNPIVYRSKSEADPQDWHFISFSAEKLGEYNPALTQWKTHETDPDTGEQVELEQKEAEGINLNAICAVLHATNVYQDKKIKELEQRLIALESNNEPIE